MTPMVPTFTDFGDRRGDATSAEFLARIHSEIYAARLGSAAPPLMMQEGPLGTMIALDRETLSLKRFVLLADLAAGSSASAQAIGYDFARYKAGAQADLITVYDAFGVTGGPQVGKAGEYGFACWQEDAGRWEVVGMSTANANDDFFLAYISARTTVSSIYSYSWSEYEVTAVNIAPTAKSGGRSGTSASWPAVEINNRKVNTGSLVWMKRVFKATAAVASMTKTTPGNSMGQAAIFSLYVSNAVGGTYTITWGGYTTAAIAYNANAATVKAAIEAAVSGLTLNAFTGAGTSGSPWVVSASSTTADVDARADGTALQDGSGFAFAAPAGSTDLEWTATKTSDYTASVGEAVVCDISGGDLTVTLPDLSTVPTNGEVWIETLRYTSGTGKFVSVVAYSTDKIDGTASTTFVLADYGVNIGTDVNNGGIWRFRKSSNAAVGWASDRYLST